MSATASSLSRWGVGHSKSSRAANDQCGLLRRVCRARNQLPSTTEHPICVLFPQVSLTKSGRRCWIWGQGPARSADDDEPALLAAFFGLGGATHFFAATGGLSASLSTGPSIPAFNFLRFGDRVNALPCGGSHDLPYGCRGSGREERRRRQAGALRPSGDAYRANSVLRGLLPQFSGLDFVPFAARVN